MSTFPVLGSKGQKVAINDSGLGRLPSVINKNLDIARINQVVLLVVTPIGRFHL
jgi:hypothetical protein